MLRFWNCAGSIPQLNAENWRFRFCSKLESTEFGKPRHAKGQSRRTTRRPTLVDIVCWSIASCAMFFPGTPSLGLSLLFGDDDTTQPKALLAPFDEASAHNAQTEWARYLKRKVKETNKFGMRFVLVPPGQLMMGSGPQSVLTRNRWFPNFTGSKLFQREEPAHQVRLTKPFFIGRHEVTRGEWRIFISSANYRTDAERDRVGGGGVNRDKKDQPNLEMFEQHPKYNWSNCGFEQDDDHPVINVSWNDAVAFCDWLSKTEGKKYRLPSEAEWEYSCRSGSTSLFHTGDDPIGLTTVGNVLDDTATEEFGWYGLRASDGYAYTAPVARYKPNAFGIFDMHGNVSEWCQDYYHVKYYSIAPVEDPPGPAEGSARVVRGGDWNSQPVGCRSAYRFESEASARAISIGFRIVWEQ